MINILLDAGHGRETPGKRSPVWDDGSQLFEWELNRDIVRRVSQKLKTRDIAPHIVTPEDADIPLAERVRRVNDYVKRTAEPCLLISVHSNAGGGTGWEAWTSVGKTKSDEYVRFFYKAAHDLLPSYFPIRADGYDGMTGKESAFYILTHSACPAILTENLFMDKEADCRFLMSGKGRDTIANIHVKAVLEIITI